MQKPLRWQSLRFRSDRAASPLGKWVLVPPSPSVVLWAAGEAHWPLAAILRRLRKALLSLLQTLAVLVAGLTAYGLALVLGGAVPLAALAGVLMAATVYFGGVRSKPKPWLPSPQAEKVAPSESPRV